MSKPYAFKFQYNGLKEQMFCEFYNLRGAQYALRCEVEHYISLFDVPNVSHSVIWNEDATRADVKITMNMQNRPSFQIDSAVFWIEDNELLEEREQTVAAGGSVLRRLVRYLEEARDASLTNEGVEKLVKLVALLESAENDFIRS